MKKTVLFSLLSILLHSSLVWAQITPLCLSKQITIDLENGKKSVGVGMLYGGIADAQEKCMKQAEPDHIPCEGKECKTGEVAVLSRHCRLKIFPDQSESQAIAENDKDDPSSIQGDKTFAVQETTFPCVSGQESCKNLRAMGTDCRKFMSIYKANEKSWKKSLTTGSDGFAVWNNSLCPSPFRGKTISRMKEPSCLNGKIVIFPRLEFHSYCIGEKSGGHKVSAQVSWEKNCVGNEAESEAGTKTGTKADPKPISQPSTH